MLRNSSLLAWAICAFFVGSAVAADNPRDAMLGKDASGQTVYRGVPMEARFKNAWPDDLEREFQARARAIVAEQAKVKVAAGNTFFENEKRTYGYLMAQALGDNWQQAIKDLQIEDCQANEWHRETKGIDYYACFTLKHQVRKYFYFSGLLESAYRQRMFDGAKNWTAEDPLRRQHYAFKQQGPGWGPDAKNSWVDVRNTENLFLMRVTSVYLMAEETGNRKTAELYKEQIRNYAKALYRVGMGEWDSENYHGHSMGPLCNLYDFAKDPEVKMLAKASLDWIFAAGAVKYYRGGFNGPTKRDYNHVQPFGGSAASMLWLFFGDAPKDNVNWESDEIHLITSNYRPPEAVVSLARKRFDKPLELLSSKPNYDASTTCNLKLPPEYHETQYFGNTFQMGSLAEGTLPGGGDVCGFKILVRSEKTGCGAIQATPGPDPLFVGSPAYQEGKVSAANRAAQNGNTAIWLVEKGDSPWVWVLPKEIEVSREGSVTFFKAAETWIAIHPIGLDIRGVDGVLTERIAYEGEGDKRRPRWADHQVVAAQGTGGALCGFAVEICEKATHGGFGQFKQKVLKGSKLDAGKLGDGAVEFLSCDGRKLKVQYGKTLDAFQVWKDDKPHDWADHGKAVYGCADEKRSSPIEQAWLGGKLTVRAGGKVFECTVDEAGKVR